MDKGREGYAQSICTFSIAHRDLPARDEGPGTTAWNTCRPCHSCVHVQTISQQSDLFKKELCRPWTITNPVRTGPTAMGMRRLHTIAPDPVRAAPTAMGMQVRAGPAAMGMQGASAAVSQNHHAPARAQSVVVEVTRKSRRAGLLFVSCVGFHLSAGGGCHR